MIINILWPRQNCGHFADYIYRCIFLNKNVIISLKISLKFMPKVRINNIPTLVQIMPWRRTGDKPLSETMMVSLLTHICVTQPQWVNSLSIGRCDSNFKTIIFKPIIRKSSLGNWCEIALRLMPTVLTNENSTLVHIMAWCCQTSHYLSHCSHISMSPYGVPMPQ